eukprot:891007-Pelagomonas_calceolata.AAC.5
MEDKVRSEGRDGVAEDIQQSSCWRSCPKNAPSNAAAHSAPQKLSCLGCFVSMIHAALSSLSALLKFNQKVWQCASSCSRLCTIIFACLLLLAWLPLEATCAHQ